MNTDSMKNSEVLETYCKKYHMERLSFWTSISLSKRFARRKKYVSLNWDIWHLIALMRTGLEMETDLVSEILKNEGIIWQDKKPSYEKGLIY